MMSDVMRVLVEFNSIVDGLALTDTSSYNLTGSNAESTIIPCADLS